MGYIDEEEQKYLQEVEDVKKWWSDSRWRYTKRPFTAEQIVQKRGNIKIEYPSNVQAKKLWRIVEDRFKVSMSSHLVPCFFGSYVVTLRTNKLPSPTVASNQLCLPKWQNTLILSTSPDGNLPAPPPLATSLDRTWLTIQ